MLVLGGRCPYSGCGRTLAAGEQAQVRRALISDSDIGSWTSCFECVAVEAAGDGSRDGLADALAQILKAEAELDGLPLRFWEEAVGDVIARLSPGWRNAAMALTRAGWRLVIPYQRRLASGRSLGRPLSSPVTGDRR